ncbi:MAG: ATP-binding cassette domain-containing protein [Bdellovibrionales bacterium]|nr:ATP-binding cassette domain-containing protein [Bdellovibrionales bacterium]NQZ19349.1 ATP-binding cassette domain-containing protein [Bdellovibrionales bacterium]
MVKSILSIQDLNAWRDSRQILNKVNFSIGESKVLAIIGPRGSGRSSLLRCINRLFEEKANTRVEGVIEYMGENVLSDNTQIFNLRREIGMIFSEPTHFNHMSVFENVAISLRLAGYKSGAEIGEQVEWALNKVSLWEDLKSDLHRPTTKLEPYQLQLLCLARTLVVRPKVILMDEPTNHLDMVTRNVVEQALTQFSGSIVCISHDRHFLDTVCTNITDIDFSKIKTFSGREGSPGWTPIFT